MRPENILNNGAMRRPEINWLMRRINWWGALRLIDDAPREHIWINWWRSFRVESTFWIMRLLDVWRNMFGSMASGKGRSSFTNLDKPRCASFPESPSKTFIRLPGSLSTLRPSWIRYFGHPQKCSIARLGFRYWDGWNSKMWQRGKPYICACLKYGEPFTSYILKVLQATRR